VRTRHQPFYNNLIGLMAAFGEMAVIEIQSNRTRSLRGGSLPAPGFDATMPVPLLRHPREVETWAADSRSTLLELVRTRHQPYYNNLIGLMAAFGEMAVTEIRRNTTASLRGGILPAPGLDVTMPVPLMHDPRNVETWAAENPSAILETTENPPPALLNYLYGFVAGFGQKP
jgi:hypothetical protein